MNRTKHICVFYSIILWFLLMVSVSYKGLLSCKITHHIANLSQSDISYDSFTVLVWEPIPEEQDTTKNDTYTDMSIDTEIESIYIYKNELSEDMLDQLNLMAYCVMSEAGNQEELGKRLVIDVIFNRVHSDLFPNTIYDVIYQKNPTQFSVTVDDRLFLTEPSDDIFPLILEEYNNPTDTQVLYFSSSGYVNGTPYKKVGDHYFSTQ